jgi:hypothetical protein
LFLPPIDTIVHPTLHPGRFLSTLWYQQFLGGHPTTIEFDQLPRPVAGISTNPSAVGFAAASQAYPKDGVAESKESRHQVAE